MSVNKIGPDPTVLLKMNAPLNVQVMRVRANQREPIPLPVRNGYNVSGPGWTHDELQNLNEEILEIAAGGIYEIIVVDSSEPRQSHKWQVVFPADVYGPSKPPTTMAGYAGAVPATPPPFAGYVAPPSYGYAQPQPPPRPPTPIPGYGQPPYGYGQAPPYGYGQSMYGQAPYGQPPPFGFGQPFPGMPLGFGMAPTSSGSSEVEALKNELAAMRLASVQAENQRKLEELQAQHRREMETARRAPQTDDKYEREREAREKAERDAIEARRQAEATAAEARHQAQFEAIRAQIPKHDDSAAERRYEAALAEERRRFDVMKADSDRRFDTLTAELTRLREAPRGPDPFTIMLELRRSEADAAKETARIQAEAAKETERLRVEAQRLQAEAATKNLTEMRSQIINPVEMARLLHDASKSGDELTRTMIGQFTDIMNLQQQATQSIMAMQPQGEGVTGRVVAIAERVADRFTTGDTQVRVAQANAARAQADAAKAQMQSMQPGWQPPPPVVQPGAGGQPQLAGPSTPTVDPAATGAPVQSQVAPVAAPAVAPAAPAAPSPLRAGGKTDDEWFGPALGDVANLRAGAAMFLDAVSTNPPKTDAEGNVPGLQPDQAAYGLLVAANEITKQAHKILAFEALWNQQMYAQLIDVLLPDVVTQFGQNGQMYKQEMFKYLERLLNGLPLHTPEELAEMRAAGVEVGPTEPPTTAANTNGANGTPTPPAPPVQPPRGKNQRARP